MNRVTGTDAQVHVETESDDLPANTPAEVRVLVERIDSFQTWDSTVVDLLSDIRSHLLQGIIAQEPQP